ncbi:uncharacterized protein NEMAJ01_0848 [Nematocida major]|uniref:uncharacterized protein n=1 Tax=Nematocida major TaxID=1912982 RepID=UPI0020081C77|nr:uncharacterized protein NEMAJ01_0848 [Nematocida major]KAH9385952.1 hypothetical protein NEMAJ01_0848 [Nematocida major]
MSDEHKQRKVKGGRALETLAHLVLMGLALFGCVLNARRLCERKERAISENVETFKTNFSEILKEVCRGRRPGGKKTLRLFFPNVEKESDEISQASDDEPIIYMNKQQSDHLDLSDSPIAMMLARWMSSKIANPFLFGFKNLALDLSESMDHLYKMHGYTEDFNHMPIVRKKMNSFFRGELKIEEAVVAIDMFYFFMLDVQNPINIKAHRRKSVPLKVPFSKDYVISMCYLGEAATCVLGKRVEALQFNPMPLVVTKEDFSKSMISRIFTKINQ